MLQGRSTEGLYGLANICEVLCYNGQFEMGLKCEYKMRNTTSKVSPGGGGGTAIYGLYGYLPL